MNRSGIRTIRRSCILICALVGGCAHNVAISYHGKSEIDPDFTKPDIIWNREQVQLNGWLSGKIKPSFQSLFKGRAFLNRQPKTRGGIAPVGYVTLSSNNPNGRRGKSSGVGFGGV
jgi:hypothetical protein